MFEDRARLREAVQWLLNHDMPRRDERFLSTVLVAVPADPGESTRLELEPAVERIVAGHRGLPAGRLRWSFDGPQRAISCGHALAAPPRAMRIGIHTGEVVPAGERLAGDAVDAASMIASAAGSGEVWVSRVVRDLVSDSRQRFTGRPAMQRPGGSLDVFLAEPPG
jgi:class 3 adenylate cyclase